MPKRGYTLKQFYLVRLSPFYVEFPAKVEWAVVSFWTTLPSKKGCSSLIEDIPAARTFEKKQTSLQGNVSLEVHAQPNPFPGCSLFVGHTQETNARII